MSKRVAEHHTKAAEHHEQAALHHREAARHCEAGDYERAACHTRLANVAQHLATRSAEAGEAHLEHSGDVVLAPSTLATVKEMESPRVAQSAREATEGIDAAPSEKARLWQVDQTRRATKYFVQ